MILKVLGVEVGTKNRSKYEIMMRRHLGIDFSWILVDLGSQVGAMLGSKIDQKSIQKAIEKQIRKRRRLGGVLEASWASKSHGTRCTGGHGGGHAAATPG